MTGSSTLCISKALAPPPRRPLWNFLPPQPHRDYPGCHHIGDLVLRVQPAVETDPASWAMYSSAQVGEEEEGMGDGGAVVGGQVV